MRSRTCASARAPLEAARRSSEASLKLSASQLARRIAELLEEAGLPYGIGGALAVGVWGFPRATKDVDLDVFVPAGQLEPVYLLLESAGCQVDRRTRGLPRV